MITKRLIKVGSSYALIIDKAVLNLLGIEPDSELAIHTNGIGLYVHPLDMEARRKKLISLLGEIEAAQSGTFKKLAEGA